MKRALLALVIGCAPAPVAQQPSPAWISQTRPYGSTPTLPPATGTAAPPTGTQSVAPAAPAPPASGGSVAPAARPAAPASPASLAERYRSAVDKIVATAHADRAAYQK